MLQAKEKAPSAANKPDGAHGAAHKLTLETALKNRIQSYFHYDFSPVRLEEGPIAQGADIAATASGNTIRFAPGQFSGATPHGRKIIAHEFSHLAQQQSGRARGAAGQLLERPELEHSAHADAEGVFNAPPQADMPLLPYRGMAAPVQPYRLVQPGAPAAIAYTQGLDPVSGMPNAMFATNKVVHYLRGVAPLAPLPDEAHAGANFGQAETGIDAAALAVLQQAIGRVAAAAPTPADWAAYYSAVGRLSEPQIDGDTLGQSGYWPDRATAGAHNAAGNGLAAASKFKAGRVTSNAQMPLLVSQGNQFAVSAAYPEPKEAYSSAPFAETMPGGLFSIKFLPTGNSVTLNPGTPNTIQLNGYKPQFVEREPQRPRLGGLWKRPPIVTTSEESAETDICNRVANQYYPPVRANRVGDYLDSVNLQVPWSEHVAGTVTRDGGDSITVENGARKMWLARRGNTHNDNLLFDDPALDGEMNKTWYFRLYGPASLGQSMRPQTEGRFA